MEELSPPAEVIPPPAAKPTPITHFWRMSKLGFWIALAGIVLILSDVLHLFENSLGIFLTIGGLLIRYYAGHRLKKLGQSRSAK